MAAANQKQPEVTTLLCGLYTWASKGLSGTDQANVSESLCAKDPVDQSEKIGAIGDVLRTDCAARSMSLSRFVELAAGVDVAIVGLRAPPPAADDLAMAVPCAAALTRSTTASSPTAPSLLNVTSIKGASHRLRESGLSNRDSRSSSTAPSYALSPDLSQFQERHCCGSVTTWNTQDLVAAALARHHISYLNPLMLLRVSRTTIEVRFKRRSTSDLNAARIRFSAAASAYASARVKLRIESSTRNTSDPHS